MGIVKIAAQFGVPLVPTFTFNQRAAFDFYIPRAGFLHKLGRKIGFIPLYYSGWLGIPYGQPKPVPLTLVVGSPIMVPKMAASELIEANLLPYQLIEANLLPYQVNI
ncbi:hypothetical protein B484DRAFT_409938 [Ochromonadaceae sp. CCMP2298]|nr:hypothetical protein B484DRAFT_409938 [Ochromonadaceae sp. CCMP2298]